MTSEINVKDYLSTLREYLTPDWPAPTNVSAACTTRVGGVSVAPYESFNLATHVGDDQAAVQRNRELLISDLKLTREPYWLNLSHSNTVIVADDAASRQADGAYTKQTNLPCVITGGDCLPILLCDNAGTKVAALHGGWRSLASGIVKNAMQLLNTDKSEMMAWLGPAIGPDAFEVGPEVRDAFIKIDTALDRAFVLNHQGKYQANIFKIARMLLAKENVLQVYGGDICTVTDPRFYSYRGDHGKTGRMAALVWLNA